MHVYRDADLKQNRITGTSVAVVGYGNQGHAHAQNLRDSGARVVVGARPDGHAAERARHDGFETTDIAAAVRSCDTVAILLPDEIQGEVFRELVAPHLRPGALLVFAHGYTVAFGAVVPPPKADVVLVAPKGQGHFLRSQYVRKGGVMCLVGVEQDATGEALERALSYAQALGCLRACGLETTFREEAATDLFGEQAVLCGGVPALVKAAFDTLVEAGYDPRVAYIECLHELKIITDLMYRGGVRYMRDRISRTAAWGSVQAEGQIVDEKLRAKLRDILSRIESGEFARGWQAESAAGQPALGRAIEEESRHRIEKAGGEVRSLMPSPKEDAS